MGDGVYILRRNGSVITHFYFQFSSLHSCALLRCGSYSCAGGRYIALPMLTRVRLVLVLAVATFFIFPWKARALLRRTADCGRQISSARTCQHCCFTYDLFCRKRGMMGVQSVRSVQRCRVVLELVLLLVSRSHGCNAAVRV